MSSNADAIAFLDRLLTWLNLHLAPQGVEIGQETLLFTGGMINSIRILELIAWVERETGNVVPDSMIMMANFRTPLTICATFAAERDD